MTELNGKVNYDNLIYKHKSNTADVKFDKFDNAFSHLNKIRDDKISLTDAKKDQGNFKEDLREIKNGDKNKEIKRAKKRFLHY